MFHKSVFKKYSEEFVIPNMDASRQDQELSLPWQINYFPFEQNWHFQSMLRMAEVLFVTKSKLVSIWILKT